jgi:hypothetical protein
MKPKPKAGKAASKKATKHPVPEWMDSDIAKEVENLDFNQRLAMAEKLERVTTQLREFKQPPVKLVGNSVPIPLRPKLKEAVILFAEQFGGKDSSEESKVALGIRWVLEIALPKMEELKNATLRHIDYGKAEGLEPSVHFEQQIGDAIEKWKAARAAEKERADED